MDEIKELRNTLKNLDHKYKDNTICESRAHIPSADITTIYNNMRNLQIPSSLPAPSSSAFMTTPPRSSMLHRSMDEYSSNSKVIEGSNEKITKDEVDVRNTNTILLTLKNLQDKIEKLEVKFFYYYYYCC